jgi:ribonuclease III
MDSSGEETSKWAEDVEALLNYRFQNIDLLVKALTHRSYAYETFQSKIVDNERLEFLGDAVLDLVMTQLVMERFPDHSVGELTRIRASIVNDKALAELSRRLGLGPFILLGKGENQTGGREKASILADCYEAVVGAVYLDGGYAETFKMLASHFSKVLARLVRKIPAQNFKNLLQEESQTRHQTVPRYSLVRESGPDHKKEFRVSVSVQGFIMGHGRGRTKKEAEQRAAEEAFAKLMKNTK